MINQLAWVARPPQDLRLHCHLVAELSLTTIHLWAFGTAFGKDQHAGEDWRQKEKRETEDGMVGWHRWLNGHQSEQLWKMMKDREAWCASVHGVSKSRTWTQFSDWTHTHPHTYTPTHTHPPTHTHTPNTHTHTAFGLLFLKMKRRLSFNLKKKKEGSEGHRIEGAKLKQNFQIFLESR